MINLKKGHTHKDDSHGQNFWEYHPTMLSKASYLDKDFFFCTNDFLFCCLVWARN